MKWPRAMRAPRGAGRGGRQDLILSWFVLPGAAVAALLLGALLMLAFGASPLTGPLVAPSGYAVGGLIPQTRLLSRNAWLPTLIAGTQLHLGVLIAVLLAVAVYVLLWRTSLGLRIRAVGLSREASRYAGMSVRPTMTLAMTVAGALSGVAGAVRLTRA